MQTETQVRTLPGLWDVVHRGLVSLYGMLTVNFAYTGFRRFRLIRYMLALLYIIFKPLHNESHVSTKSFSYVRASLRERGTWEPSYFILYIWHSLIIEEICIDFIYWDQERCPSYPIVAYIRNLLYYGNSRRGAEEAGRQSQTSQRVLCHAPGGVAHQSANSRAWGFTEQIKF